MCYQILRSCLFALEPETAHRLTLKTLNLLNTLSLQWIFKQQLPNNLVRLMGLNFPNPIGLAAGLDKNGEYIDALANLGFGFIEVGTVTPLPQSGNEQPRLFRIPKKQALINRMGFNNKGVDYLVEQVKRAKFTGILGINIGKNKSTPIERAVDDYLICLKKVYPYAGYVTVNISSPNTPELRILQTEDYLGELLNTLVSEKLNLEKRHKKKVPLLVKVAPDLSSDDISKMAALFVKHNIDGVIVANTTVARPALESEPVASEAGGLSGSPVFEYSCAVVASFYTHLNDRIPIIGCGGITTPERAEEMLKSGARLLQIYTGLIYEGPGLLKKIADHIV